MMPEKIEFKRVLCRRDEETLRERGGGRDRDGRGSEGKKQKRQVSLKLRVFMLMVSTNEQEAVNESHSIGELIDTKLCKNSQFDWIINEDREEEREGMGKTSAINTLF
jgi:hypothetical protein